VPTPRAPDKCGPLAALSKSRPQTADSAPGGFVRQVPPLPVTPAVSPLLLSKSLVKLNGKRKSKHYQRNQEGKWNSSSNICLCYPIYLACLHFARFAHRFWMETYIYNLGGV
jgi:hypothetical protein